MRAIATGTDSGFANELEFDDAAADINFGEWLKEIRLSLGYSRELVSFRAEVKPSRLRELEEGTSKKGITRLEVDALAGVYGLDPNHIMKQIIATAS